MLISSYSTTNICSSPFVGLAPQIPDEQFEMNIGHQIKKARKEKGLSQAQLGIACGWDSGSPQSRIGNYEQGNRTPSAIDIVVLAKALDKTILYFYGLEEQEKSKIEPPNDQTEIGLNAQQVNLLKEVIFHIERNQFDLNAAQKAKLIASVFASCLNHGLDAEDLTDSLIDAARYSVI